MALVISILDPAAQVYTDDDIVGKVNTATANITRAGSVDAAARPIAAGEVDTAELAAGAVDNSKLDSSAAKDNLDAMPDTARGYIGTNPQSGQFPIIYSQRASDGKIEDTYDNVAV